MSVTPYQNPAQTVHTLKMTRPGNQVDHRPEQEQTESFRELLFESGTVGKAAQNADQDRLRPGKIEEQESLPNSKIVVVSGAQTYSLEVMIGESALAFNARPIVAPALIAMGLPEVTSRTPTSIPELRLYAQAIAIESTSEQAIPSDIPRSGNQVVARHPIQRSPIKPGSADAIIRSGASGILANLPQSQGAVYSPSVSRSSQPLRAGTTEGAAVTPWQTPTNAQLFALLVAGSKEYRVTIRGTRLSLEERDHLAMDIRAALRAYGLADRPIVIANEARES